MNINSPNLHYIPMNSWETVIINLLRKKLLCFILYILCISSYYPLTVTNAINLLKIKFLISSRKMWNSIVEIQSWNGTRLLKARKEVWAKQMKTLIFQVLIYQVNIYCSWIHTLWRYRWYLWYLYHLTLHAAMCRIEGHEISSRDAKIAQQDECEWKREIRR